MTVIPERLSHIAAREPPRTTPSEPPVTVPSIHVSTFELAHQIVLESDAIGVAVPDQIAAEINAGLLKMLDLPLPGGYTNYGIITLAGRTLSPSAETFIEILRQIEAKITMMGGRTRKPVRSRAVAARTG